VALVIAFLLRRSSVFSAVHKRSCSFFVNHSFRYRTNFFTAQLKSNAILRTMFEDFAISKVDFIFALFDKSCFALNGHKQCSKV
jgi:hypothetical protein